MKKFTAAALATTLALASGVALAHNDKAHKGDWEAKFTEMDSNDDGRISRTEFTAAGKDGDKFDRIDTDSDGFISKTEKRTHKEARKSGDARDSSNTDRNRTGNTTGNTTTGNNTDTPRGGTTQTR